MKIILQDESGLGNVEIDVGARSATIERAYNGVGISTPSGLFGVAQRDGGIEVMRDGELFWSSEHGTLAEDAEANAKAAALLAPIVDDAREFFEGSGDPKGINVDFATLVAILDTLRDADDGGEPDEDADGAPRLASAPRRKLVLVCDGPPVNEGGRFVEMENENGESVCAGEWRERSDGLWCLDIDLGTAAAKPGLTNAALAELLPSWTKEQIAHYAETGEVPKAER